MLSHNYKYSQIALSFILDDESYHKSRAHSSSEQLNVFAIYNIIIFRFFKFKFITSLEAHEGLIMIMLLFFYCLLNVIKELWTLSITDYPCEMLVHLKSLHLVHGLNQAVDGSGDECF